MNPDETPWWLQGGQPNEPSSGPMPPSRDLRGDEALYPDDMAGDAPSAPVYAPEYASAPYEPPRPRRPRPSSGARRSRQQPAPEQEPPRRGRGWRIALAFALLTALLSLAFLYFTTPGGPSPFIWFGAAQPTATRIGYARSAKIAFTRTTQPITAPSASLVAATNGSGQVKATAQSASVKGATSGNINASYQPASNVVFSVSVTNSTGLTQTSGGGLVISSSDGSVTCTIEGTQQVLAGDTIQQNCDTPLKYEPAASWNYTDSSTHLNYQGNSPAGGNTAYYYVPANCGDPSTVKQAAQAALQSQLNIASGTILMFGPTYQYNNFTCSPSGGSKITQAPYTFVQKIDASGSQTVVALGDIQAYQTKQLTAALPQHFTLTGTQICPNGPHVEAGATASKATITCAASGTAAWNWTTDALSALAQGIAGDSSDTALLQLKQTPGIVADSVKIMLIDGSELPQEPGEITFTIAP